MQAEVECCPSGSHWYTTLVIASRETLKPNLLGYSLKAILSSVLLPAPEGPAITNGLRRPAGRRGGGRGRRSEGGVGIQHIASKSICEAANEDYSCTDNFIGNNS